MSILIIISGLLILMTLGASYSWGVFLLPITQSTGWSRAEVSLAVSILLLVFSLFMPVGGILDKKIGPRRTVEIGGILVGLGWILSSYATTPIWLYLSYGLLTGIGTGFCYMPPISCGIKWFANKKGIATGFILVGFGIGAAFLSPIITHLIGSFGWRATMAFLGVAFSIIIIIFSQFLHNPPQQAAVSSSTAKETDLTPFQMVKTFDFFILFVSYFFAMFSIMLVTSHIVAIMATKNFQHIYGALAVTILAIFNGAGRIILGYASDTFGAKRVIPVLFLLTGIAVFNLITANMLILIYLSVMVIGLCFGGFLAVYPSLTSDRFGTRDFSINYGIVFIGYGIGCFFGPYFGGLIHDNLHSYYFALLSAGIVPILTSIVLFIKFRLLES